MTPTSLYMPTIFSQCQTIRDCYKSNLLKRKYFKAQEWQMVKFGKEFNILCILAFTQQFQIIFPNIVQGNKMCLCHAFGRWVGQCHTFQKIYKGTGRCSPLHPSQGLGMLWKDQPTEWDRCYRNLKESYNKSWNLFTVIAWWLTYSWSGYCNPLNGSAV